MANASSTELSQVIVGMRLRGFSCGSLGFSHVFRVGAGEESDVIKGKRGEVLGVDTFLQ